MFFRFLPFPDEGARFSGKVVMLFRMQGRGRFFSGCVFLLPGGCHDVTDGVSFVRAQGVAIVQTEANGYFIDYVCLFPAGGFFGCGKVWFEGLTGLLPVCRSGKKGCRGPVGRRGVRGYGQE
ncbi:hypothetical protein NB636_05185 [Oxalobacter aliiformigenes]|uniref:hypothetical protein n=1 Tax=Oxalobacter aliiformigenes TaxID=2946593 RepID=UPI0022AECADE|nr:hypothetical protein [Oxalobacter aliiformigenes]MCZ4066025.1 hypothetical protein [Oxalobacter aliiformigenes]WAW00240.1 hypothetical protein NB636_05185 [Oxalobacter aliiformigenes]